MDGFDYTSVEMIDTQQEHQKVQQVEKRVEVYVKKKKRRVVMPAGM